MKFCLQYEWMPVENMPGIHYHFPEKISQHFRTKWDKRPDVYRWVVFNQQLGDLRKLYIGEAELLSRRISGYLNPGPTQQTNQRLKAEFEKELENGHKVVLEMLCFESFDIEGIDCSMDDLGDKRVRRFLESLFITYYSRSGYTLLNA